MHVAGAAPTRHLIQLSRVMEATCELISEDLVTGGQVEEAERVAQRERQGGPRIWSYRE